MSGTFHLYLFRNDLGLDMDPQAIHIVDDNAPGNALCTHAAYSRSYSSASSSSSSSLSSSSSGPSRWNPEMIETTQGPISSSRRTSSICPPSLPCRCADDSSMDSDEKRWSSSPTTANKDKQAFLEEHLNRQMINNEGVCLASEASSPQEASTLSQRQPAGRQCEQKSPTEEAGTVDPGIFSEG
ncbi:hypothetical protein SEMRO_295_G110560.1 [Seminavis robusta]|uniref:Uncharacterized protein n=1 Tax=Seminavis robusta TaxID=568900 RepID=A0A9N8HBX4_9STRA|nr:hypothetical protein SEMRO_295_G110560.1 [Seminavis robusta]|eukprot:Sro295_g110560.1 n/a (184) ;mRNA; f:76697-77248